MGIALAAQFDNRALSRLKETAGEAYCTGSHQRASSILFQFVNTEIILPVGCNINRVVCAQCFRKKPMMCQE